METKKTAETARTKGSRRRRRSPIKGPCKTEDCNYTAAKVGLCINCYARYRRSQPHVKLLERENKKRYLDRPGKRQYFADRKRERCRETGYYQTPEYKAKKKAYYTSEHGRRLYAARTAKRRAQKLKATPAWLTSHQHDLIKMFYEAAGALAAEFGRTVHVDHIIPLKGKNVSGLHVPWNLQVMFGDENSSKSNRVEAA
jgi:hypothetical protein